MDPEKDEATAQVAEHVETDIGSHPARVRPQERYARPKKDQLLIKQHHQPR